MIIPFGRHACSEPRFVAIIQEQIQTSRKDSKVVFADLEKCCSLERKVREREILQGYSQVCLPRVSNAGLGKCELMIRQYQNRQAQYAELQAPCSCVSNSG